MNGMPHPHGADAMIHELLVPNWQHESTHRLTMTGAESSLFRVKAASSATVEAREIALALLCHLESCACPSACTYCSALCRTPLEHHRVVNNVSWGSPERRLSSVHHIFPLGWRGAPENIIKIDF